MIYHARDTLRYWKRNPFLSPVLWTDIPLPTVANKISAYRKEADTASVEATALEFYLWNHAWGLLQQKCHDDEPLGGLLWVAEGYAAMAARLFPRMAYYLTLITTGESRHMKASQGMYDMMKHTYGQEFLDFHLSIRENSRQAAFSTFGSNPPTMTFGDYVAGIKNIFSKGKFGSSYGGKKWADITEVLRRVVFGETPPEVLLDSSFSLCHNGGPIFNKSVFYKHYGEQLIMILDVQRAGMIPQLMASGKVSKHITEELNDVLLALLKAFPEMVGDVDWNQVGKLGALGSYEHLVPQVSDTKKFFITDTEYAEIVERQAA